MGKKAVRVVGYVLCGIMLAVCVALVFISAAFSSEETLDIFGANIYIVREDNIPTVPKDSAIIVNPCAPYEAEAGKLVLYRKDEKLALGYAQSYTVVDGVYEITMLDNNTIISETDLVGKADFASEFLGKFILFIKSPLGVFCLAIIPCVVLIFYDIIRAATLKRPLPEVIPQVKNKQPEPKFTDRGISVNADGKGTYSRTTAAVPPSEANGVLFSYTARQKKPIIPLTDKTKNVSEKDASESPTVTQDRIIPLERRSDKAAPDVPAKTGRFDKVTPDVPTKTGRFDKATPDVPTKTGRFDKVTSDVPAKTGRFDKAAPDVPAKKSDARADDAFFTQSSVPQIQKSTYLRSRSPETEKTDARPPKTKRSTEIIANKRVEDLMRDEDDFRDRNRYNDVDEIITGFDKKI